MPVDPNDAIAILNREAQVWDLLGQGMTGVEVAAKLGIDFRIVSRIKRRVENRTIADMKKNVDRVRARQVGKVQWAQRQAVKGWTESCKPAAKTKRRMQPATAANGQQSSILVSEENTIEGQSGNPAFLTAYGSLVEMEAELTGTKAPTKIAPTDPTGTKPFEPAALTEAHQRFNELVRLAAQRAIAAQSAPTVIDVTPGDEAEA